MRILIIFIFISSKIANILTARSCPTEYPRLDDLHLDKCDLDNSTCIVKAFQNAIPTFSKGLPEWGIDVMDVMDFDDPVQFDTAGLMLKFSNGRLKGIQNIIIDAVKWDVNKKTVFLEYHAPTYTVTGKYLAGGQILILPITGDGDMKVKLKNLDVKLTMFLDIYKRNNKTYASIKNYIYDFNVEGNVRYNLTNLFNGNKDLSDTVLKFMNDNWRDVTNEFGRPLMDAVANKIFRNINRFLAHAPLEDVSLSYQ